MELGGGEIIFGGEAEFLRIFDLKGWLASEE